ncbi:NAD(P)-dependent oxidoreductase [uncultured Castellaniella sp.]|uniref:NAD-dependent epimerase/dehydratase family protein n=1 Tax=uncultured Castellaniella sp. TaxID=647907 RepID=UPI0026061D5D|nr:NAD(P)-dependent oxidoreductase [uncultured Castellaniella sp.]
MKVLLTGGSGFIGAWIVRALLRAGHGVRIFDQRDDRTIVTQVVGETVDDEAIEWFIGDITDADQVLEASGECDAVIHLAGVLTPFCAAHPMQGARVNVLGTLNIFEAARVRRWGVVAYASSAGVFGPENPGIPDPRTLYGVYKLACEGIARCYWEESSPELRVASIGLRPLVVYGVGRSGGSSAGPSLACRAAVLGESYTIPFSGSTGFVYVEDVADAFIKCAFSRVSGAHVCNMAGTVAGVDEFVAAVTDAVPDARLSISGLPLPIAARIEGGDVRELLPDVASTSIEEGIRKTLACYQRLRERRAGD